MVSIQIKFVPPWNCQYSDNVYSALEWSLIQIKFVLPLNGQCSSKGCSAFELSIFR